MDNPELKPCPFCGGEAFAGTTFDNRAYVMCSRDACWGMAAYLPSEAEATEAWNTRTTTPPWIAAVDFTRLVIAARVVAFENRSPEALRELDQASEVFADCVPWEDEHEHLRSTPKSNPGELEAVATHADFDRAREFAEGWYEPFDEDWLRYVANMLARHRLSSIRPGGDKLKEALERSREYVEEFVADNDGSIAVFGAVQQARDLLRDIDLALSGEGGGDGSDG